MTANQLILKALLAEYRITQAHLRRSMSGFFSHEVKEVTIFKGVNSLTEFSDKDKIIIKKTLQLLGVPEGKIERTRELEIQLCD